MQELITSNRDCWEGKGLWDTERTVGTSENKWQEEMASMLRLVKILAVVECSGKSKQSLQKLGGKACAGKDSVVRLTRGEQGPGRIERMRKRHQPLSFLCDPWGALGDSQRKPRACCPPAVLTEAEVGEAVASFTGHRREILIPQEREGPGPV